MLYHRCLRRLTARGRNVRSSRPLPVESIIISSIDGARSAHTLTLARSGVCPLTDLDSRVDDDRSRDGLRATAAAHGRRGRPDVNIEALGLRTAGRLAGSSRSRPMASPCMRRRAGSPRTPGCVRYRTQRAASIMFQHAGSSSRATRFPGDCRLGEWTSCDRSQLHCRIIFSRPCRKPSSTVCCRISSSSRCPSARSSTPRAASCLTSISPRTASFRWSTSWRTARRRRSR